MQGRVTTAQGRLTPHPEILSVPFLFFLTLVAGPRKSLSLKLSDIRVYEPRMRTCLGTSAPFCIPIPKHRANQLEEALATHLGETKLAGTELVIDTLFDKRLAAGGRANSKKLSVGKKSLSRFIRTTTRTNGSTRWSTALSSNVNLPSRN